MGITLGIEALRADLTHFQIWSRLSGVLQTHGNAVHFEGLHFADVSQPHAGGCESGRDTDRKPQQQPIQSHCNSAPQWTSLDRWWRRIPMLRQLLLRHDKPHSRAL